MENAWLKSSFRECKFTHFAIWEQTGEVK